MLIATKKASAAYIHPHGNGERGGIRSPRITGAPRLQQRPESEKRRLFVSRRSIGAPRLWIPPKTHSAANAQPPAIEQRR
jgi:hypothetical protein